MGVKVVVGNPNDSIKEVGNSSSGMTDGGYDAGGIIGSIASAISGIIGSALNYDMQEKNLEQQKKQLKWSKFVQEKSWFREDNAVLRRVMDLERAGLNKMLAAGSGASTGPVVSTVAPQRGLHQMPDVNPVETFLNIIQMKKNIDRTSAEILNIEQQRQKALMETGIKAHDLRIMTRTGTASNPGAIVKSIRDVVNMVTSGNLGGTLTDYLDKLSTVKDEVIKDDKKQLKKNGWSPFINNLR